MSLCSLIIALAGCALSREADPKNKCNGDADCLNGYACTQGVCLPSTSDGGAPEAKTDNGLAPDGSLLSGVTEFLGEWRVLEAEQFTGHPASVHDNRLFLFQQGGELKGQIQMYDQNGGFKGHHKLFAVKPLRSPDDATKMGQISFCSDGDETTPGSVGGCYLLQLKQPPNSKRSLEGTISQIPFPDSPRSWTRSIVFTHRGEAQLCTGKGASAGGLCLGGYCDMTSGACGSCLISADGGFWQCEEDCLTDSDCPSNGIRSCHAQTKTCYPRCANPDGSCTRSECADGACSHWYIPCVDGFCAYADQLQ